MPARCLLYYITDRTAFAPDEPTRRRSLLDKIAEAARSNIDYIQLREKDLPTRELESLARAAAERIEKLRKENPELRTALLINSRTDIALAVRCDGVHLRSDDVSPQEVRAIWAKSGTGTRATNLQKSPAGDHAPRIPVIGVSCHQPEEAAAAKAAGATFVVFAPVFEKKDAQPAGLPLLRDACQAGIPAFALGGVTLANARSCLEAGAAGIAAIRLFQENDVATIARQLRSEI